MGQITWNTDVNAPCCPGEIVNDDGRTLLIQTHWDYPGTASSFGWSMQQVQRCQNCHKVLTINPECKRFACPECEYNAADYERDNQGERYPVIHQRCDHNGTDGTVDCKECGVTGTEFISAADEFLRDHDGATADDPGYFAE